MGEAKARRAAQREELSAALRVEMAKLMVPATEREAQLLLEIEALAFYEIKRAPDHALIYGNMKPQQCHTNAGEHARLDPSGESQHVSGWWKRGDIFYHHSVVLSHTKLVCVTPHPDRAPLQYGPDFAITWETLPDRKRAWRDGQEVPVLVRRDPAEVIGLCAAALEALDAGADPFTIRLPL